MPSSKVTLSFLVLPVPLHPPQGLQVLLERGDTLSLEPQPPKGHCGM